MIMVDMSYNYEVGVIPCTIPTRIAQCLHFYDHLIHNYCLTTC